MIKPKPNQNCFVNSLILLFSNKQKTENETETVFNFFVY